MDKKLTIFDVLNNLLMGKEKLDYSRIEKIYSPWLITRYLAMDNNLIYYAKMVNQMNIDKKLHYEFLFNLIRKSPRKVFINYIKKHNESSSVAVDALVEKYQINPTLAKELASLI